MGDDKSREAVAIATLNETNLVTRLVRRNMIMLAD
jgi:hypothetical protein